MANGVMRAASGRVLGVVFLLLVLLFVWFTYAVFTKQFTEYDKVTLELSNVGLALPTRADVKIRGVIVGQVLETTTSGDGAELTLGLDPEQSEIIPANVTALILPKTLFGEKYVKLEVPASPSDEPIQAGDTIESSDVAIEIEKVLNNLYPLLRTVQPAELNFALNAIATTLEGRGEQIGESIETLDAYLKRMNPEIPALLDSLENLGKVSEVYESVVPEVTRLLRNTVVTTNTFESNEDQIQALFDDVAGFSGTAQEFLEQNGDNMITVARQGQQILPLFARYAPEYRCFLRGLVAGIPAAEEAFRNKTLHIILETLPRQPRGYTPADKPANNDSRGPFAYCNLMYKAINGGYSQRNLLPERLIPQIRDGVNYPLAKRTGVGDAIVGTADQQAAIDIAASAVLGVPVSDVPDLATLLLGPIARGKAVSVR